MLFGAHQSSWTFRICIWFSFRNVQWLTNRNSSRAGAFSSTGLINIIPIARFCFLSHEAHQNKKLFKHKYGCFYYRNKIKRDKKIKTKKRTNEKHIVTTILNFKRTLCRSLVTTNMGKNLMPRRFSCQYYPTLAYLFNKAGIAETNLSGGSRIKPKAFGSQIGMVRSMSWTGNANQRHPNGQWEVCTVSNFWVRIPMPVRRWVGMF